MNEHEFENEEVRQLYNSLMKGFHVTFQKPEETAVEDKRQRMLWKIVNRDHRLITEFIGTEEEAKNTIGPLFDHMKKETSETFRVW